MIAQYITLDFTTQYLPPIYLNQYEANSRDFVITCKSGSLPIDLTGSSATFYAKKPDSNILFNACTIVDAAAGKIQYTPTSQTCAAAGALTCQIVIVASDLSVLRSMEFKVTVNVGDDYSTAVESTSEFTALDATLAAVSNMVTHNGAASAGNIPVFTDENGDEIEDSGVSADDVTTGPSSSIDENIVVFDGTDGKTLKDSGIHPGKTLWSGTWSSGEITVPEFDKYTTFKIAISGQGTPIIATKHIGNLRGVGGMPASGKIVVFAVDIGYSGTTLTLDMCASMNLIALSSNGSISNQTVASISGLI